MRLLTPLLKQEVMEAPREPPAIQRPQGRPIWDLLSGGFGNPWLRVPQHQNLRLYEQLVQTVPLLNAAIWRTVQLVGCPYVSAKDKDVAMECQAWLDALSVNRLQTGYANAVGTWLYHHLLYGRAHMEMVLLANRRDVYALQQLHTRTIELRPHPDRYSVEIVQNLAGESPRALNPRLVLTAVHGVTDDSPQGNGMLFGIPWIAEIITSMMRNLQGTWERFGNPMYVIRYKPPETLPDPQGTLSQSYISRVMSGWNQAMTNRAQGDVQDVGFAGDVTVEVVGAAGETLEFTLPYRSLAEQVVAATFLPPMLLGLQWQAGERIGAVQAGMLSERVLQIRNSVTPELEYLIRERQRLAGKSDEVGIRWHDATLLEAKDTAQARLWDAQAEKVELENRATKWRWGVLLREEVARESRPDLEEMEDAELLAHLPDLLDEAPMAAAPAPFGAQQEPMGAEEEPEEEPMEGEKVYRRGLFARNGRGR